MLIPRPETECLVEAALEPDAGPGPTNPGGCWNWAPGRARGAWPWPPKDPQAEFFAAGPLGRGRWPWPGTMPAATAWRSRVRFLAATGSGPLSPRRPRFDLIVSNPPYIPSGDIAACSRRSAATNRGRPWTARRRTGCLAHASSGRAPRYLQPGGWLLLEIGHDQQARRRPAAWTPRAASDRAEFARDYGGHVRVAAARRSDRDDGDGRAIDGAAISVKLRLDDLVIGALLEKYRCCGPIKTICALDGQRNFA